MDRYCSYQASHFRSRHTCRCPSLVAVCSSSIMQTRPRRCTYFRDINIAGAAKGRLFSAAIGWMQTARESPVSSRLIITLQAPASTSVDPSCMARAPGDVRPAVDRSLFLRPSTSRRRQWGDDVCRRYPLPVSDNGELELALEQDCWTGYGDAGCKHVWQGN